jgi:hypothetical protein
MAELVDDRAPDLLPDFGFGGAHRFDILLLEDDVIRPGRQVEDTLLGHRHPVEESQKELLGVAGWSLAGQVVFHQHGDIANAAAEFFRERVDHFLHDFNKRFALQSASLSKYQWTEIPNIRIKVGAIMNPLLIIVGTAGLVVLAFGLATMAWLALMDYFEKLLPSCRWK